jgi:hypothetical protein
MARKKETDTAGEATGRRAVLDAEASRRVPGIGTVLPPNAKPVVEEAAE